VHQLVGAGDRDAKHFRHHFRIEEQRQLVRTCVSEVSLLDCLQMASAFSEARRAARLLQQFGGFHFCRDDIRSHLFSLDLPCTTGRSCRALLARRLSQPWYARLLCAALWRTSPASIFSGDGYVVVKVHFPYKRLSFPLTTSRFNVRLIIICFCQSSKGLYRTISCKFCQDLCYYIFSIV